MTETSIDKGITALENETKIKSFGDRLHHLMQSRLIPKRNRVSFLKKEFAKRGVDISPPAIRKWLNGTAPKNSSMELLQDSLSLSKEDMAYLSGYLDSPSSSFNVDSVHHTVQMKIYVDVYKAVNTLGFADIDDVLNEEQQQNFFDALFSEAVKDDDFEVNLPLVSKYIAIFGE